MLLGLQISESSPSGSSFPLGKGNLFIHEHTHTPTRQPAPVYLTSNYSKNFNYAAGKCQVSKDPASGYGPLVFISGLGDPPPFQVASIASSSPKERV